MSGLRLLPKLGLVGGGWAWDDSQTPTHTPPAPQEDEGEAMSQSEGEDMSHPHFVTIIHLWHCDSFRLNCLNYHFTTQLILREYVGNVKKPIQV